MNEEDLAPLSKRFVAALIDVLILIIPSFILSAGLPRLGGILLFFLYEPVFLASGLKATPGKYFCDIQVTDLDGGRISFRVALVRSCAKFVSSLLLFLGHLFAFYTWKKQALHDLIADTVVMNGKEAQLDPLKTWVDEIKSLILKTTQSSPKSDLAKDDLAALEKLQALREKGALTEEEFQREKQKILDR